MLTISKLYDFFVIVKKYLEKWKISIFEKAKANSKLTKANEIYTFLYQKYKYFFRDALQ